tara:strand:- start:3913 stop:5949 length:2037 start_codon:yes stop_codon:yes gene_type:complete
MNLVFRIPLENTIRVFIGGITLIFFCGPTLAKELMVLRWSDTSQLAALIQSDLSLRTRHIAPKIALIEANAHDRGQIEQLGLKVLTVDPIPPEQAYFLSDHLHHPLPEALKVVYVDQQGWALSRIANSDFDQVHDQQIFLYPLPIQYDVKGWITAPRFKPTAPATTTIVEDIIGEVNTRRLRTDVENLALIDPAAGSITGNIRTRFARRRETFESTIYIQKQLSEALGNDKVHLQEFKVSETDSIMYNVVGELTGNDPEAGYYVICAHYDAIGTRSRGGWNWRTDPAPGADDNASGVALVLESARILASMQFAFSIRFIAWSGEELGLYGSKHYAQEALKNNDRIIGVLNFDMIGFNDLTDRLELVSNPNSVWLVDLMQQANELYDIGLRIDELKDPFAGLSDHAPFWARGYDAILGIENYLPTDSTTVGIRNGLYRLNSQYHSVVDLPDSINWNLVNQVTRLTVATLAQFGSENGLPNLMISSGDLSAGPDKNLRIRIGNVGTADLDSFVVQVSRCDLDSSFSSCQIVFEEMHVGLLAAGAVTDIIMPWEPLGESIFLIEVDPDNNIKETKDSDNQAFQNVHLVPTEDIIVYPNPYNPRRDRFLAFSGLPLFSRVEIATLDGNQLWIGEENRSDFEREVRWNGINDSGFAVGSGVYIYSIRASDGKLLKRDKIALVP